MKLAVKENAMENCCKPRTVPFAIKEAVEKEIDRLEEKGIISSVSPDRMGEPDCSSSQTGWECSNMWRLQRYGESSYRKRGISDTKRR